MGAQPPMMRRLLASAVLLYGCKVEGAVGYQLLSPACLGGVRVLRVLPVVTDSGRRSRVLPLFLADSQNDWLSR